MNPALRAAAALLTVCTALAAQAFDLQGHRGARGLAPENSLAGFERALALGVTTLELDVAITRDGVLVIHHDLALNPDITRDADGRWLEAPSAPIATMSYAELQRYDVGRLKAGSRYGSNYPEQQAIDGTRIPRLADLFDLVQRKGNRHVRFAIETKLNPNMPDATRPPEEFAWRLLDEIQRAGLQERVHIQSFDWRTLQVVQRLAPEVPTVYLSAQQSWLDNIAAGKPEGSKWTAGFQHRKHGSVPKMVKAAGGHIWSVFHGDANVENVHEAQALGLKVLVWTVNDPAVMERLIGLGVNGLITDRPDLALEVLKRRGIELR